MTARIDISAHESGGIEVSATLGENGSLLFLPARMVSWSELWHSRGTRHLFNFAKRLEVESLKVV